MKTFLLLAIVLLLSACRNDAKEITQNGNFQLELLFIQDGCKVYRFLDGGRCIYWSTCAGKLQRNWTSSSGKSTVTHHDETVTVDMPEEIGLIQAGDHLKCDSVTDKVYLSYDLKRK